MEMSFATKARFLQSANLSLVHMYIAAARILTHIWKSWRLWTWLEFASGMRNRKEIVSGKRTLTNLSEDLVKSLNMLKNAVGKVQSAR